MKTTLEELKELLERIRKLGGKGVEARISEGGTVR